MPRIAYAKLPGGYIYMRICPPGYKKNFLLRQNDPDFVIREKPNDLT